MLLWIDFLMNPIKLLEKIYTHFHLRIYWDMEQRTKMILYYNFNLFLIAIEIKPLLKSHISSVWSNDSVPFVDEWCYSSMLHFWHYLTSSSFGPLKNYYRWGNGSLLEMAKTEQIFSLCQVCFLATKSLKWFWLFLLLPIDAPRILQSLLLCIIFYK